MRDSSFYYLGTASRRLRAACMLKLLIPRTCMHSYNSMKKGVLHGSDFRVLLVSCSVDAFHPDPKKRLLKRGASEQHTHTGRDCCQTLPNNSDRQATQELYNPMYATPRSATPPAVRQAASNAWGGGAGGAGGGAGGMQGQSATNRLPSFRDHAGFRRKTCPRRIFMFVTQSIFLIRSGTLVYLLRRVPQYPDRPLFFFFLSFLGS